MRRSPAAKGQTRRLTVLVGGASESGAGAAILEVIGGSIHRFGDDGARQQVAGESGAGGGSYAAVAEAISLGQRLDLPMPR